MSIALAYWILMLLWVVWAAWASWRTWPVFSPGELLIFALLLILGWRVFGPPIHG